MTSATFQLAEIQEQLFLDLGSDDGNNDLKSTFQGNLGDSVVVSEQPVIVLFKDGRTAEFGSIEGAKAWVERAGLVDDAEVAGARIYVFHSGQWKAVKKTHPS